MLAQSFQNLYVFNLLQGHEVRATTTTNLLDNFSNNLKFLLNDGVVPVPLQALIYPSRNADTVTTLYVTCTCFKLPRRIGAIILSNIVTSIEQVLDIKRHD